MKICKFFVTLVFIILTFTSFAIENISIERGAKAALPIAINKFSTASLEDEALSLELINVISNDLKSSGLFRPISRKSFIETTTGANHTPSFTAWRQINASVLLNGEIKQVNSDKIVITFALWDINLGKSLVSESFEIYRKIWRRVAHKISDKIYEKITGENGYFDTKVVYVAESGPVLKRKKRIAIMDLDGANHKYLTNRNELVLTPKLSPNADKVLYLAYVKHKKPKVYLMDLKNATRKLLGSFHGMTFAPSFSPDGKFVLMSIAFNGSSHIFEVNLETFESKQLTFGSSINTSPSYSPDGKRAVFNSDRNGSRQLYIMDKDGSNLERISYGSGSYADPAWSPKDDFIAFTKISPELGFSIGVINLKSQNFEGNERVIANGYLVESPCWSPNGKLIMYNKSWPSRGNISGKIRLFTIDITGFNELEINTPFDASCPDWSKSLK